jgi:hypothetical protein
MESGRGWRGLCDIICAERFQLFWGLHITKSSHLCHGLDPIVLVSTNLEETWFFFHRKLDDRVNCASSFGWCRLSICDILIFVSWYGRKLSHGLLLLIESTYQHVVGYKQLKNYWTSIQAMIELVKLMTGDSKLDSEWVSF